jgi:hypothetical protein
MPTNINKPIKVGAIFKGASIHPVWFIWEGRKYTIKEVNYTWGSTKGEAPIHYFSVSDECNSYKLSFDSKNMTWRIESITS